VRHRAFTVEGNLIDWTSSPVCTIIGAGATVVAEIAEHGIEGEVMTLNDSTAYWHGPIHHAFSMHAREYMHHWLGLREARGRNAPAFVHSLLRDRMQVPKVQKTPGSWLEMDERFIGWEMAPDPGFTGVFAVYAALAMGFEKIRILGSDMEGGHFWDMSLGGDVKFWQKFPEVRKCCQETLEPHRKRLWCPGKMLKKIFARDNPK